jgi:short-subunit dehydrogenase involved in D-alanine esterification of teichoic acids
MKTAVVTGGAHGIGKIFVQKLLLEQCEVIALDINDRYLAELKKEYGQMETLPCDVGNADEVQAAFITG